METVDLVAELRGMTCRCGAAKHRGHTFCRECFYRLPTTERHRLYDPVGAGYEEAHAAAVRHLDRVVPR